jgi:hypothetical protein
MFGFAVLCCVQGLNIDDISEIRPGKISFAEDGSDEYPVE